MTPVLYTTRGNVRGGCGHKHRSVETAARCLDADIRSCRRAGDYSDRRVVRVDGEPLSESEKDAIDCTLNA